ncbi:MAG: DUF3800 domain-containing protein [Coriobacteriia bacterium]|nr:DUF3800 domain-containing protein [Coriobacteriia bacterium]
MKILSVFVDESGDFGTNSKYYLLSFVFHNQTNKIEKPIQYLKNTIVQSSQKETNAIHSYPLIRREGIYKNIKLTDRKSIFNSIVAFMRYCKIQTKTIAINKKHVSSSDQLAKSIEHEVNNFLDNDKKFFQSYDKIIVYYDQGQKQITKILFNTFLDNFNNVDFRVVKPQDYYLFQVADLTCTLEMIDLKKPALSNSEKIFFGSMRDLKKNYLKVLYKKRLD